MANEVEIHMHTYSVCLLLYIDKPSDSEVGWVIGLNPAQGAYMYDVEFSLVTCLPL